MQLIIDTNADSPGQLRAAVDFLQALAGRDEAALAPTPAAVELDPPQTHIDPPHSEPAEPQDSPAAVFTQGSTPPAAVALPADDTTPSENSNNAPTSTGSVDSVELDADGLPWDARIHASSKARNADGRWRGKRGVHEALVTSVTEQLQAVMAAPAAAAPVAPPALYAATDPVGVAATPAIAPPPAATPTVAPFPALMQKLTAAQTGGQLSPAQILDAVRAVGLNALPDLIHRPDLIPAVSAQIDQLLAGGGQ